LLISEPVDAFITPHALRLELLKAETTHLAWP